MHRLLDLFSGIGAFSLGLERAGFQTVAFCEIEPFRRSILAKHWPTVRQYDDVRTLTADRLLADGIAVDTICGGFPCQDISVAGGGAGLAGKRSGLWFEYLRLIEEISPNLIIVENVAKLRHRGLDQVLSGLDALGYDAEWHCLPAAYVGAPHRRDRLWVIAYRQGDALGPYADSIRSHQAQMHIGRSTEFLDQQVSNVGPVAWWSSEPGMERVVDGPPSKLDIARIRSIGDSVVPFIPELIGRAILAA
jgi:DNA (cytosine-5)-methyltransferase 1